MGFTFLHYTDVHAAPEPHAARSFARAVDAMKRETSEAAFALCGGDLVFDVNDLPPVRAASLYDLYQQQVQRLDLPLYHCFGNHDLVALNPAGCGVAPDDPSAGRGMYLARLGLNRTYYSFDHDGWHFVVLDTVDIPPDHSWRGFVDDAQLAWLAADLQSAGTATPTVLVTHFPLLSAFTQYTVGTTAPPPEQLILANGKEIVALIQPYNVKAVLQGHTHVVEEISYLGVRYISAGSLCGDWWKGSRLGVHPPGFTLCAAHDSGDFSWRYIPTDSI